MNSCIPSRRLMESAFRLVPALPPAGPGIFAWHHRFRAMRTANARIVAVVQFVVRYFEDLDIGPHVGPSPFGEGIHLNELKCGIPLKQFGMGSVRRLLAPDAGD